MRRFSLFSLFTANVERNTQVRRNYTTPHKTQMIDTTINLLVNRTECTNLSGTTLTLRLAVKSDNSSPAILFRDSEKLDATIKLSLTLPTARSMVRRHVYKVSFRQKFLNCPLRLITYVREERIHVKIVTLNLGFALYLTSGRMESAFVIWKQKKLGS